MSLPTQALTSNQRLRPHALFGGRYLFLSCLSSESHEEKPNAKNAEVPKPITLVASSRVVQVTINGERLSEVNFESFTLALLFQPNLLYFYLLWRGQRNCNSKAQILYSSLILDSRQKLSLVGFNVSSKLSFFMVMAYLEAQNAGREIVKVNPSSRKPRILLAASGSVAAIKFGNLCHCFSEWAEVKAVATKAALHFIDRASLPKDVNLYTDEEEWSSWSKIGDNVLHIELRRWADIMVIAPLSANTLGKIAGGLCDNLLTCVVRAWDYNKPFFVAPAMNTFMWSNPFTEKHLMSIDELGISLIPPVTKRLACGDYGNGAMAEPNLIHSTVRLFLESRPPPREGRAN
ncbi:Flavoprotein [Corchorus capsularis]|uniref:phosphopantothenoylcysteine decarboxylase n=1 Tax=Corchorus capsularis TaxID=210143 RepID=A0A1R3IYF5_COCAP|nr:Flavoprotein [Corchorus capsularis]